MRDYYDVVKTKAPQSVHDRLPPALRAEGAAYTLHVTWIRSPDDSPLEFISYVLAAETLGDSASEDWQAARSMLDSLPPLGPNDIHLNDLGPVLETRGFLQTTSREGLLMGLGRTPDGRRIPPPPSKKISVALEPNDLQIITTCCCARLHAIEVDIRLAESRGNRNKANSLKLERDNVIRVINSFPYHP